MRQVGNDNDVLIDYLGAIDLTAYIESSKAAFVAKEQHESTCYANALAAAYQLALLEKYYSHEKDLPTFESIRDDILKITDPENTGSPF